MAFHCRSEPELIAWRKHLQENGVNVSPPVRHELIESIYFTDPNDYPLEITRPLRAMNELDATDAEMTVAALIESVATGRGSAEDMWLRKARLVEQSLTSEAS
jgi:catechol-2,3-dioxygenase